MWQFYQEIINAIWLTCGVTDTILRGGEEAFYNIDSWKRLHNRIWLIYTSCLIENNDLKMADKVLDRYKKFYGNKDIEKYPVICRYIKWEENKDILNCSEIFNNMLESVINEENIGFIKNKSVAIVGECEESLEKEVDAHDIVIRFNAYNTDYKNRTDILVVNQISDLNRQYIKLPNGCKNVIYAEDIWHTPLNSEKLRNSIKEIQSDNEINIYSVSKKDFKEFREKSVNISNWLLIVYLIKKYTGCTDNCDIYGLDTILHKYKYGKDRINNKNRESENGLLGSFFEVC